MVVQELDELMQWLSDFGVRSPAFDHLRELLQSEQSVTMRKQPSLVTAVENVAALREELYMTDSQVWSITGANCTAMATCARAKWLNCMVFSGASVGTTSVLAGLTCLNACCPPRVRALELSNRMQSLKPQRLGTTARPHWPCDVHSTVQPWHTT